MWVAMMWADMLKLGRTYQCRFPWYLHARAFHDISMCDTRAVQPFAGYRMQVFFVLEMKFVIFTNSTSATSPRVHGIYEAESKRFGQFWDSMMCQVNLHLSHNPWVKRSAGFTYAIIHRFARSWPESMLSFGQHFLTRCQDS